MTQAMQRYRMSLAPLAAVGLAASLLGGIVGGTAAMGMLASAQSQALETASAEVAQIVRKAEEAKWLEYGRSWERQHRVENGAARWGLAGDRKWLEYGREWERQYRAQGGG